MKFFLRFQRIIPTIILAIFVIILATILKRTGGSNFARALNAFSIPIAEADVPPIGGTTTTTECCEGGSCC